MDPITSAVREGTRLVETREPAAALEVLQRGMEALGKAQRGDSMQQRAELLLQMSRAHKRLQQYTEALECTHAATVGFKAVGDPVNLARAAIVAGKVCIAKSMLDQARGHFEEVIHLVPRNQGLLWRAHQGLGNIEWRKGNFGPGLRQAREGLEHAEEINNLAAQAQLHALVGGLLQDKDDLPGSQAEYEIAIGLFRAVDDPVQLGYCLNNMSDVLIALGDAEGGIWNLRECLAVARACGDERVEAYSAINLVDILRSNERYDEIPEILDRAEDLIENLADPYIKAYLAMVQGSFAAVIGDWDQATKLFSRAAASYNVRESPSEEAQAYIRWADALAKEYGPAAAEEKLEKAEMIGKRIDAEWITRRAGEIRAMPVPGEDGDDEGDQEIPG